MSYKDIEVVAAKCAIKKKATADKMKESVAVATRFQQHSLELIKPKPRRPSVVQACHYSTEMVTEIFFSVTQVVVLGLQSYDFFPNCPLPISASPLDP